MLDATLTSGERARAAPALGAKGLKPSCPVSMYSAFTWRSTAPRLDCFIPFASTAMKVTSARPIIRAAAVEAVRPGFLRAFSPESLSVAGSNRSSGSSLGQHQPLCDRAQAGGELGHEPRGENRDADEEQENADRQRQQANNGRDVVSKEPIREQSHREADDGEGDVRQIRGEPPLRQRRSLTH